LGLLSDQIQSHGILSTGAAVPSTAVPLATAATTAAAFPFATAAATAAPSATVAVTRFLSAPALQYGLAAEADFAGRVDVDHHGREFIADVGDLLDIVDAVVGQLTDMDKSVDAGQQVDKGAVGFDSHNLPGVDFANFDLFGQGFDFAASLFGGESILARDKDRAIVVDIDLDFVTFLQSTNGFAARADNLAYFFPGPRLR
jgi:hypothetical protein